MGRGGRRTGEGRETIIRFGKYNGSNVGLKLYLWGVEQANLDLGVFQ